MKKLHPYLNLTVAGVLLASASSLTVAALFAASPTPTVTTALPPWPDEKDKPALIAAFTAVLTKAAKPGITIDTYRKSLGDPTIAKEAVKTELNGSVALPAEVFILFYLPQDSSAAAPTPSSSPRMFSSSDSSYYHVFYLPPVDGKTHEYKDHLRCCYPVWIP
jgi:hypothetical protein